MRTRRKAPGAGVRGHPSGWRAQVVLTTLRVSIWGRQMCLETDLAPGTCPGHLPVASIIRDLRHPYLFTVSGHALCFPELKYGTLMRHLSAAEDAGSFERCLRSGLAVVCQQLNVAAAVVWTKKMAWRVGRGTAGGVRACWCGA